MSLESLRIRLAGRREEIRRLAVGVLAGGGSSEREISLISGQAVADALCQAGYQAEFLRVAKDDLSLEPGPASASVPAISAARDKAITAEFPDLVERPVISHLRNLQLVVTTLHGTRGEDGVWQGVFELLGVPYVSAGVKGSALAMDKLVSKRLFLQLGIPTPRFWVHDSRIDSRQQVPAEITDIVAKPVAQGSSVGIAIVQNDDAGWAQITELSATHGRMLIEERIFGRELTMGVIGHSADPVELPVVEIKPRERAFYDYTAKYTKGETDYLCPAALGDDTTRLVQQHALTIYREFELAPYARIDCLLDAAGVPWFLEANTLPGFTPLSLLPQAAQAAGVSFVELLELIMLIALERAEGWTGGGHGG